MRIKCGNPPQPPVSASALLVLACLAPLASMLPAAAFGQMEVSAQRDTVKLGRLQITGYPYVFYSPETEFALGGAIILTQRLSSDTTVKPSSAMISGYYSAKASYDLFFNPEFYLGEDRYYLGILADYWRFVDKFWGFGNNSPDSDNVGYIRKIFSVNVEFDVRVVGPLKVGVNYDLNHTAIEDKQSNPYLLSGSVTGSDGGTSSGLGLVLFADTRNGAFYPTSGGSYKLSFLHTVSWLGSTFKFSRWIADIRHYFPIADPLVLAAQLYATGVRGDPPFYMVPALGGDNQMRGYYEGRYRDRYYGAIQGELRWRITRRWGLVGWAGVGDVAGTVDAFRLDSLKPTVGVGVRFALDPEEVLNVRADFAYGKNTNGMYFNAKEAF
jgi:outer membrane protein assembly factor BamA